ncbi:hypothetical protein SEA_DARBY_22 [Arthrobacter phage Darby]|uniref:Minor tail protein n=1 Tax=Arthrobacter phage Darby TaxID=2951390 RepID=A0A9E7NHE0_9CAUD|nr:hypothetical protein QCN39_gp22 [Arthrobacter phage Darby]UTN92027.1 hypothetical protein SEA_DARBY_22 [Arthrobacter phage Darby]
MVNTPDDPNQAQAWISGTPPDQTIDFYIPRGNTGPRGPVGPIGPSLAVGSVETVTGPAAPGTVGATGLTGPKGDPGGFTLGTQVFSATDANTLLSPGIYRQVSGSSSTYNWPVAGKGVLTVWAEADQTELFQEFMLITNSRVFYRRNLFAGTWSAWRAYSSTRVDQTAGRAIYTWDDVNNREQMIHGDTGWRSIVADVLNGWTATALLVRRVGATVFLRIYQLNGTTMTNGTFATLPAGFRSGVFQYEPCYTESVNMTTLLVESTGNLKATGSTIKYGTVAYAEVKWSTTETWPTTLPGVASGSIPT